MIFHTIVVHDSRVGHALTQGRNSKVKVTVHTHSKSISVAYLVSSWMGDDLIVVHDTGVVLAGGVFVPLGHV